MFRLSFIGTVVLLSFLSFTSGAIFDNPSDVIRHKRNEGEKPKVCQPNSHYEQSCNRCVCNSDGTQAACTRRACPPDSRPKRDVEKKEQVCEPNSMFDDDCNLCMCNPEGTGASCTRMGCPPITPLAIDLEDTVWLSRPERNLKEPKICEPGTRFKKDCNWCNCNQDGTRAMCTLMACPPEEHSRTKRDEEEPKKQVCEPGSRFKKDCNWCYCNEDGTLAMCTQRGCSSRRTKRDVDEQPKVCEPLSTFKVDCNTCRCNNDGTAMACTRRFCPPEEHSRTKRDEEEPKKKVCEPGSRFKKDCNWCNCNEDGTLAMCTLRGCPSNFNTFDLPRTKRDVDEQPKVCEPLSTFKVDCNTCRCNNDGTAMACTRRFCPPEEHSRTKRYGVEPKQQVCEPGSRFKKDCNWCTCNADGTNAACTEKACLSKRDAEEPNQQVCEPGSRFKMDCNWCTCNADGTNAACTEKACLSKRDAEEPKQQVCEPGSRFKMDCNWCTCSADGTYAACTLKGCLSDLNLFNLPRSKRDVDEQPKVCEPLSTFKVDCNTCRCNNDGTAMACTRRFCPPEEHSRTKRDEEEPKKKVCEPGSRFKKDCNWCNCNEDGTLAMCTLRGCPSNFNTFDLPRTKRDVDEQPKVCEPLSTFKVDCNTCRCNNDGTAMACSRRFCPPEEHSRTKRDAEEPKQQFCEPGSRFKKDCNWCKCNDDGTNAACTLIGCPRNIGNLANIGISQSLDVVRSKRNDEEQEIVNGGQVCTPGETKMEDCNRCRCSNNGIGWFCTRKVCPKTK